MKRDIKIHIIRMRLLEGYKDKQIIDELGMPKRTYFYWKSFIRNNNVEKLLIKSRPGPKPKLHIDAKTRNTILNWRKRFGWGPTKIEGHLDVHFNKHLPHNRIHELLIQEGMNKAIQKPRKTWGRKRWERDHSMSLWQGDWKDVNSPVDPMLTFYDDHSRYVVASRRFAEATTENTIKLLEYAFRRHGTPEQILTDRGTQFWNNKGEDPTEFTQCCINNGVGHIKCSKGRPTTTGKIENFHGRYDEEIWVTNGDHRKFVRYWNRKRPNGAIGFLYPVEVFYRDRKSAINVPIWEWEKIPRL
jgi:putative transposase